MGPLELIDDLGYSVEQTLPLGGGFQPDEVEAERRPAAVSGFIVSKRRLEDQRWSPRLRSKDAAVRSPDLELGRIRRLDLHASRGKIFELPMLHLTALGLPR